MRLTLVFAAAAFAAGLSGCETDTLKRLGIGEDEGMRCDVPRVGDRVHIEIRYAADGTPSAVPDECTVAPGTRIAWLGPDRNAAPFELTFPGGSPAGRDAPPELRSSEADGRQKAALVAGEATGRYKYQIAANGVLVDPAIIIER